MTKTVLVTGANGFVGQAVCRRLLQTDLLPRAGLWDESLWPALHSAVPGMGEFSVLGDLGSHPDLNAALENVAVVIHLAARVHVMRDDAVDPLEGYRRVNTLGTEKLARAAAERGVGRFVYVSTTKVNGEATFEKPFTEEDAPRPQDPYAISKWEAEEALRSISSSSGLEVVIVRPPLVYGPGVRANFLSLMRLVAREIPIPLPDTKNRRSLIGVENLADLLVTCVTHPEAAGQTFLVSDCEDVSTRELIVRLARALGCSHRFLPVPEFMLRLGARLAGKEPALDRLLGSLAINSQKAHERLGWTPPEPLDQGLAATARWYRESLGNEG